jgi:hypothetical protein
MFVNTSRIQKRNSLGLLLELGFSFSNRKNLSSMLEEGREIESKNEKGDGFVFPGQKINLSLFLLAGIRKANLLVY